MRYDMDDQAVMEFVSTPNRTTLCLLKREIHNNKKYNRKFST
jgi:hypothetical protein